MPEQPTPVGQRLFFDTIFSNGATEHLDVVDGIITHVVIGRKGTIFICVDDGEDIPGNSVAYFLQQLGMLHLLPFLVPDHPAAEFAKSLPPPTD